MQIVVCAGKSRAAPGTSFEQVLLWAADTDGSSLWRSTILLTKYSPCPWGCCLILNAGFCLLKASAFSQPTHASPPYSLCFCSCCHLPDDFPYSHVWLIKAGDRKRKRKWLWLGTCIHPCSSFSSRWSLSAVLPFSCFVFVHTTLVVPSSPPTQHLHRCSWVRLEESTQVSESCWLTWNSWSWTSREYSVLSSSHSVFH